MPTIRLRDLKGRPIEDDVVDVRDVRIVAAPAPMSEAAHPPAAPSVMPEGAGAATVWKPWEEFVVDVTRLSEEPLPIAGPPCARCAHWKPRRKFLDFQYDGVRMCWRDDGMASDFSCFAAKE